MTGVGITGYNASCLYFCYNSLAYIFSSWSFYRIYIFSYDNLLTYDSNLFSLMFFSDVSFIDYLSDLSLSNSFSDISFNIS